MLSWTVGVGRVLQLRDRDGLVRARRVVVGLGPVRGEDTVDLEVGLPGVAAGDAAVRRTSERSE